MRRVETRRASCAFMAVFKALLISSRNIAMPFAATAPPNCPWLAGVEPHIEVRRQRCRPAMNDTQAAAQAAESGWSEPQGHRAPGAGRRHRARRNRLRRGRPRGRRGLLQHRDDRLRGDPHRSVLCGADHHLHVPAHRQCRHQRGGHRDRQHGGDAGRARRDPPLRHHRAVELPRHPPSRPVAQEPRHHRAVRHRHARAHQPDPHQGHAERRDRARARRQVRPRGARRRRRANGPASSAWTSCRW